MLKRFFFNSFVASFVFGNECANIFVCFNNISPFHKLFPITLHHITNLSENLPIHNKLLLQELSLLFIFLLYLIEHWQHLTLK